MTASPFKIHLKKSIAKLFEIDKDLLDEKFNTNERTITHRLALHLTCQFPEYDVDCECNRMVTDKFGNYNEGDYWVKTINLSIDKCISGEDDEAKTVFPDIIIHKRKKTINLAVIEIKMKWKNSKKAFDYQKLISYKTYLKYKFAVYLELDHDLKSSIIDFI